MILIIGLGNPGPEYENTLHNMGRMAVIKFRKANKLPEFEFKEKFNSLVSEGKIKKTTKHPPERIAVTLPNTFMNKSGNAAGPLAKSYKIKPVNIIVIHDDSDIRLGSIKIVKNRNSGGHKGVESVMRALKTKDFIRVRIGTTRSISKKGVWRDRDLMEVVIKKIPKSQKQLFARGIKLASDATLMIVQEGLGKAMSKYNKN